MPICKCVVVCSVAEQRVARSKMAMVTSPDKRGRRGVGARSYGRATTVSLPNKKTNIRLAKTSVVLEEFDTGLLHSNAINSNESLLLLNIHKHHNKQADDKQVFVSIEDNDNTFIPLKLLLK